MSHEWRVARARMVGALLALPVAVMAASAAPTAGTGMIVRVDATHRTVRVSPTDADTTGGAILTLDVPPPTPIDDLAPGAMVDYRVDAASRRAVALVEHRFAPADAQGLKVAQLRLLGSALGGQAASETIRVGQAVPDFSLVDHRRQPVRLSALRGRLVAVSFMYTSCHLPDYCFRLTNNFSLVQKRFADRLDRDLTLLTITFDPVHDQPEVLARYATDWHVRGGWRLLGGPPDEVRRVCRLFGMQAFPEMGMMAHDLRTAVIDRRGRLAASIAGNEFTGRQLGDLIQELLD
jgi:protein SCO1/2